MVRGEIADQSAESVVRHLVENPADMQRPIAVFNGKAIIGRPAELVLDILE